MYTYESYGCTESLGNMAVLAKCFWLSRESSIKKESNLDGKDLGRTWKGLNKSSNILYVICWTVHNITSPWHNLFPARQMR